jgi:hypothetical protein
MLTVPSTQFAVQVLVSDSTAGLLEEVLDQWDGPAESAILGPENLKIFEKVVIW